MTKSKFTPRIYFRTSQEVEEEWQWIRNSGLSFTTWLSDLEGHIVIPRYNALPFYKEVEGEIKMIGGRMINSYQQHQYVADIKNWYPDLQQFTPKTWFDWTNLPEGKSFVVKGRTNSRKFEWNRRMFASSKKDIPSIAQTLLDDTFIADQGLVIREYVPLVQIDKAENGLPISIEYRYFCYQNTILSRGWYWAGWEEPKISCQLQKDGDLLVQKVANIVSQYTNFFVVDIGLTQEGKWIVIELNDGQMSGLCETDPREMYEGLFKTIGDK